MRKKGPDTYRRVRRALRQARAYARKQKMKGEAYAVYLRTRVLAARRAVSPK
jgi:hypothetical protein